MYPREDLVERRRNAHPTEITRDNFDSYVVGSTGYEELAGNG